MNREPIHKNLSTSFVDLEALVKHLSDLQFVGSVHVELSSYEAEIIFADPQNIRVREYHQGSGSRIFGPHALERIFAMARESFGRIHVYRTLPGNGRIGNPDVYIDEAILLNARRTLSGKTDTPAIHLISDAAAGPDYSHVMADLLQTVKTSLKNAQLDFPEAFRNTCSNLASVYPFLHPNFGAVRFTNDAIELDVRVAKKQFTDAIGEVLSIIISRVAELSTRSKAIDGFQNDLRAFAKSRQAELERLGLSRLPELLLDQI